MLEMLTKVLKNTSMLWVKSFKEDPILVLLQEMPSLLVILSSAIKTLCQQPRLLSLCTSSWLELKPTKVLSSLKLRTELITLLNLMMITGIYSKLMTITSQVSVNKDVLTEMPICKLSEKITLMKTDYWRKFYSNPTTSTNSPFTQQWLNHQRPISLHMDLTLTCHTFIWPLPPTCSE